ncbi:hypothetical protein QUA43_02220 [Microcoleus sp. N9_B4]|uniref:hypothetical protein n=1 Tax=Microcoleus sp. N9_B4 TaxID=3055386 RepID=UPI002FD212ED
MVIRQAKWWALWVSASDRRLVSNLKIQQTAATLTRLAIRTLLVSRDGLFKQYLLYL